jgi:hypothetical protein
VIDPRDVEDAVLASLRAAHPGETPTAPRVGDNSPPVDPTMPYAILYTIPGGGLYGSLAQPSEMLELVVQVSNVGDTRQAAEWMRFKMRTVVLGRDSGGIFTVALTGAGWAVIDRDLDADGGITQEGAVHTAVDRYRLVATPV